MINSARCATGWGEIGSARHRTPPLMSFAATLKGRVRERIVSVKDAAGRRTISERTAVRPVAVPAGGGTDARLRHHGPRQSGPWLALHDGRIFRGDFCRVERQFHPRYRAGA